MKPSPEKWGRKVGKGQDCQQVLPPEAILSLGFLDDPVENKAFRSFVYFFQL